MVERIFTQEMWEADKAFSAVEPDGSMQDPILKINLDGGYRIYFPNKRSKQGFCDDPAVSEFYLQRPQEIARLVFEGKFDLGITGADWLAESDYKPIVLGALPISRKTERRARIALVVSKASGYQSVADLPFGCMVATEYVQITKRYLYENGRNDIEVMYSFGNTEEKIALFGAAAIVEIVETGSSLVANNLAEIDLIMETEMVIITNEKAYANTFKRAKMECYVRSLIGALRAKEYVRLETNVPESLVDRATEIIGGMKGATKSPLTREGWYALISVVSVKEQNRIISELLQIGVTDICRSEMPLIMI